MKIQNVIDELLMYGTDDWVYFAVLVRLVQGYTYAVSDIEVKQLTFAVLREVDEQGLMEIGDANKIGIEGFQKWDLPLEEALARIEKEWDALGRDPSLWEICWLCNTEKGNVIGENLIKLWISSQDCKAKLLMRGYVYEWVEMIRANAIAEDIGEATTEKNKTRLSQALIREVLEQGLMEIGDRIPGGFRKWEMSVSEAMNRVVKEWDDMVMSSTYLLRSTSKGKKLGEEIFVAQKKFLQNNPNCEL